MTAAELRPELRNLIEARLEAIDRILARAEVGWSERRSIVGEVETQIYELLARRSSFPAEEDVLAVLASLDPPEAYIPDDRRDGLAAAPAPAAEQPRHDWRQSAARVQELAARFGSGAVCAAALVIANGIVLLIIVASDGVIPWLVTLSGLAWLNYAGVRLLRRWSAARTGNLFDELRYSLGTWLMPKNGAQAT